MKKNRIIPILIVCVILSTTVLTLTTVYSSQNVNENTFWLESINSEAYQFPILPDVNKEEWAKFETNEERAAVLQIPNDVLKTMSTEALLATCLQYPNLVPVFAFNSPQRGIEKIIEEFNGLQELLSREDVGDVLFEFYTDLNLDVLLYTDDFPALRLLLLEYTIAQPSVLLNISDRETLLNVAYDVALLKQKKYSDDFSVDSTLLILARILEMDYPVFNEIIEKHEVVSVFLETGSIMDSYEGEWDEILTELEKIKKKIT